MSSYIYTFIRNDISPAQKIVQIGHACYEAGKRFTEHNGISNLVLLVVEDEAELLEVACMLDMKGIEHYVFFEPDNEMGHSAICTRPLLHNHERLFFRKWKLYRHTD